MRRCPNASFLLTLGLGALLAGCAGGPGGSPGPGEAPSPDAAPGELGEGERFVRQVAPFPVFDETGRAYAHPFLGGFDVPRPQFVDIDGDGDLDLFVQERTGALMFFENVGSRGTPEYVWRTDRWRDLPVGEWSRFTDLDGDGDLDLLAEEPFSYVRYYRNEGSATEPDMVLAADSVKDDGGEPIFSDRQNIPNVADIDGDGLPDLFLGRVDGTVVRYEMEPEPGPDGEPRFVLRAERFEDIEIVAQIAGQRPGDVPDLPPVPEPSPSLHGANSMGIADVDGDGDLDFLWGDFFEPSVLLIENIGTPESPNLRTEPRPVRTVEGDSLLTSGYNVPVPVDVDGDGDLDLAVGILGGAFNPNRTASDNFHMWERTAEGPFRLTTTRYLDGIDVGSETAPAVGDLDGDGLPDLLVGNKIAPGGTETQGQLYLFRNRGAPGAPELHLTDTLRLAETYHFVPVLRDMDGDGDLDLISGTWNDDVLYFENVGSRTEPRFERADSPLVVLTRGSNSTPALGDVDGDGLEDLFVGESSGELNFYRNVGAPGAPEFELVSDEFQEIDAGRRSHPALFDWDGDGDLDLILGSEAPGAVLWLNDGSGVFTEHGPVLPELPPFSSPVFFDVDGDGDLDLLSGDLSGGVVFFENRTR